MERDWKGKIRKMRKRAVGKGRTGNEWRGKG